VVKSSLCPSTKHWMSLEPSISSTLIAMCCILSRYAGAVLDSVLESEAGEGQEEGGERVGREGREGEEGKRKGEEEKGRGEIGRENRHCICCEPYHA